MQLWIDNTGLQSAGLCLERRARRANDDDVHGLLQLATLVIYSNKVSLSGFEPNIIAQQSNEIVAKLQSFGITKDILSINSVNEKEYALACMTAANSIAPYLYDRFNPVKSKLIGGLILGQPPDLPLALQERLLKFVALASEQEGSTRLQEVEEIALTDKASGAVEYMMACSPALREAVARILAKYPNRKTSISYQLNAFLRFYLNEALAEQSLPKSNYAPAIARARLASRQIRDVKKTLEESLKLADGDQYVINALGEIVDKTATELRGSRLGIPSTLAALLERSKGEPEAIFKEAMEFRVHSGPLRDALETLTAKYPGDTDFEIKKLINDLGQQLRREVKLDKSTTLRDALDIKITFAIVPLPADSILPIPIPIPVDSILPIPIPIPLPAVSIKELRKRGQERKLSKLTAVLTELVKASARSNFSTDLYETLRTRSTEKT